jgi:hypothetical protein
MSEKTQQDEKKKLIKLQLRKMEEDRKVLTDGEKKWYLPQYPLLWLTISVLFILEVIIGLEISLEMELLFVISSILSGIVYQLDVAEKRIDKIVELIGAEKRLEIKYKSRIKSLNEF